MKKKNKIILIAATLLCIFTIFSVTAFADSDLPGEPPIVEDSTDDPSKAESTENVFEDIYNALTEHADKIFAALAFVGTMIVSFAYRKGLIPLLGNAIKSLNGSVETIKENGTALVKSTDDRFLSLCQNMQNVLDSNDAATKSVDEINEKLNSIDIMAKKYDKMQFVLESQIDMLYAIFISSSLPQYQKEEVGNKINQMKEELAKYE